MASITSVPTGVAPDLSPAAGLFSTDHIETPYGTYDVTVKYDNNEGLLALPIAKPPAAGGPTLMIVRLHAPVCKKIVEWSATRRVLKPLVPTAISADPALVLLSRAYWPLAPRLLADGITKVYGMAGVYVYACSNGIDESAGFPLSFPSYQQATGERFGGEQFVTGIVG